MGITKREIASELGVSKRTVANYIEKLGLGNHVSRNGNTDFLDDFAAAAIADALDRQNPRLSLGARDSVEELRQLKVSHLGALAFPRPAQHGYVPLHG